MAPYTDAICIRAARKAIDLTPIDYGAASVDAAGCPGRSLATAEGYPENIP